MIKYIFLFCLFITATLSFGQTGSNDIYCPSSGVPLWGTSDGVAQLPISCYNTYSGNTPAPGSVINVSTAAQLTTALASAACGQQITLQAGNTFSGNFTIPALSCSATNYLWITTSGLTSLPTEGARYTTTYNGYTIYLPQFGPCYSGITSLPGRPAFHCPGIPGTYTAKVITPNSTAVFTFTTGTSHVRISGLEITRISGIGTVSGLIKNSFGNIDHLIFDRLWCHGIEQNGSGGGDETNNCVNSSATSYVAMIDGYYSDFYCIANYGGCVDAHAADSGLNTVNFTPETVFKIVNNFMEGSGETIIIGGAQGNTVPNDLEYRLDTFFKPLQWNPSDPSYNGGVVINTHPAQPSIVKNLFELKNGNRVLLEGIQAFNSWGGFTQNGHAFLITPKNPSNTCPVCTVSNVTIRYSLINSAASSIDNAVAVDDTGHLPAGEFNISEHDVIADNLAYPTCNECAQGSGSGTSPELMTMTNDTPLFLFSQILHNITISHITNVVSGSATYVPNAILGVSGSKSTSLMEQYGLIFINNVGLTGQNGTLNHNDSCGGSSVTNCYCGASTPQSGINALNACWKGPSGSGSYTFTDNCIIGTPVKTWPTGNVTSISTYAAVFNTYNNGNAGDYTIASGACKGIATDGTDPGANLPLVAKVIAGAPVYPVPYVHGIF